MKWIIATFCFFLVYRALAADATTGAPKAHAAQAAPLTMRHACQPGESWEFRSNVSNRWREEFRSFLSEKTSASRGFAEALAMRRLSVTRGDPAGKTFSEYWIARVFFKMKLYGLAYGGFSALAPVRGKYGTAAADGASIQGAAIQCLGELQKLYPSLEIPRAITLEALRDNADAADALLLNFLNQAGDATPAKEASAALSALNPHTAHYWLAKAVAESRRHDYAKAAEAVENFFTAKVRHDFLSRFSDAAHLLAGRAYYSLGRFAAAIAHLHSVSKRSNDLAEALSGLTWSYLMASRLDEAVGAAIHLRAGGMKNTFTPEASMVGAMALNELCQYPASLQALRSFRARYAPVYLWLKSWSAGPRVELYPMLVGFLKGAAGVPRQIAGEWARTPHFLARQEELNLLVNFGAAASELARAAAGEQRQARSVLIADLRDFIRRYKAAKASKMPGQGYPAPMLAEFERLKSDLSRYRRFAEAGGAWKRVIAGYNAKIPLRRARLVSEIEADLSRRTATMLALLDEIAENNQLIESEIFNGASQDLIWKNAHPDFAKFTEGMADDAREPASASWNWGKTSSAAIDDDEIWEDELGFAKADVSDNCANKEKYLRIKLRSTKP